MATLETQYKNFKINNPTSTFTFEEWKEDFSKKLEKGFKQLKMNKEFITYEQALALEEFGFDEHCFGYYDEGGNLYTEMVEVLKAPLY